MAFTLQIKEKSIFRKKKLDFQKVIEESELRYGSNNDFYVLKDEEINNDTAILYNPDKIGRGIFFNGSRAKENLYEISYNIPTTRAEINDFIRLAEVITKQLGKVEMYCVEEERNFTVDELKENFERFVDFSTEKLNEFCSNKEYDSYILTLALWPYCIPQHKVDLWSKCSNLSDFENTLHHIQSQDIYYASPNIYQNNENHKIGAFYVLTEGCKTVYPLKADGFLNMDQIKIDQGFIQFYIYSEDRFIKGLYPYDKFIEEIKKQGAELFDKTHVSVPPMSKNQLENLAKACRESIPTI